MIQDPTASELTIGSPREILLSRDTSRTIREIARKSEPLTIVFLNTYL